MPVSISSKTDDLFQTLNSHAAAVSKNTRVAIPGTIQTFDPDTIRCVVLLGVKVATSVAKGVMTVFHTCADRSLISSMDAMLIFYVATIYLSNVFTSAQKICPQLRNANEDNRELRLACELFNRLLIIKNRQIISAS